MARIQQQQLIQSREVLGTITPAGYTATRGKLGGRFGFQSVQYRQLEYMFGNKNADMLAAHEGDAAAQATLSRALARTSIYDETLRPFARRGFPVPDDRLE